MRTSPDQVPLTDTEMTRSPHAEIYSALTERRRVLLELVGSSRDRRLAAEQSPTVVDLKSFHQVADEVFLVSHAIEKLRFGAFGRCEKCGESLPRALLLKSPLLTRCMGCSEQADGGVQLPPT